MAQFWQPDSQRRSALRYLCSCCVSSKAFGLFCLAWVSVLLFSMTSPARAACSNNTPPANTNVTCTGVDTVGVNAAGNNVNVSVQSGANVNVSSSPGSTIRLLGSSTLTNAGSISESGASAQGVFLSGPNSTVTNGATGSIVASGSPGYAINIDNTSNNAVINNSGLINGNASAIVSASLQPVSGSITVVNNATGTITSSVSSGLATIDLDAHGSLEVDNYGVIQATSGAPNAITLSSPINTVLLGTSASITGKVIPVAGGNNTLILGDTGTASFNLNNVGPGLQYQNFTRILNNSSGTWMLTGTNTLPWMVNQGTLTIASGARIGGTVAINGGTVNLSAANSTIGGNVTLGAAGTLTGVGVVMGNTSNGGAIVPGTQVFNPTVASVGGLTLQGNYTGQSGATLNIRTQLNGDNSPTDQLIISGTVSGTTKVYVSNLPGGKGALTTNGIPLIIAQSGPSGAFVLGQPVQVGMYQYLLMPGGSWDLFSRIVNPSNPTAPMVPLYRCAVPVYAFGHVDDVEYGFSSVGDLHARVGELHAARESTGRETWGRVLGQDLRLDGSLFTAKHNHFELLQVGQDLGIFGGRTHTGAMLTLGGIQGDFYYPARATIGLDTRTGRMVSQSAALGLYWTHFWEDRAYVDAVVQGNHYKNRYSDACPGMTGHATQRGWGEVVSIEGAYPITLQGPSQLLSWAVEPEAQVAYQHLGLGGFNDGISDISSVSDRVVRGRLGLRLFQQSNAAFMSPFSHFISPYLLANIYRDFRVPSDIEIAGTTLTNSLSKTWGEVGVGFNGAWLKHSISSFADVRYQSSLDHRRGLQGIIGLRVNI